MGIVGKKALRPAIPPAHSETGLLLRQGEMICVGLAQPKVTPRAGPLATTYLVAGLFSRNFPGGT